MDTTVVHLFDTLMERQLDAVAAGMLKAELKRQGIKFAMGKKTVALTGETRVTGLRFEDGTELAADLVVMAAGIVPNTELAKARGIETGRGIKVDDYLQTSAADVYAVGECCEHRGVCYGLVAPLYEQGSVLARRVAETAEHRVLRNHDDWRYLQEGAARRKQNRRRRSLRGRD